MNKEEELTNILQKVDRGAMDITVAFDRILHLFSVRCECDDCKTMNEADKIDNPQGNGVLPCVSVSLRDYIATECMKSEIISWNKEMSNQFRAKLLEDMIARYGNIKINNAIALMSYEMADAMLSARSHYR